MSPIALRPAMDSLARAELLNGRWMTRAATDYANFLVSLSLLAFPSRHPFSPVARRFLFFILQRSRQKWLMRRYRFEIPARHRTMFARTDRPNTEAGPEKQRQIWVNRLNRDARIIWLRNVYANRVFIDATYTRLPTCIGVHSFLIMPKYVLL